METPRSLTNHGRLRVTAVIVPGGKEGMRSGRGQGQNAYYAQRRARGRTCRARLATCIHGPIWKHIFRAVNDGEQALFPAELAFILALRFSSSKWPSTISQRQLFPIATAI